MRKALMIAALSACTLTAGCAGDEYGQAHVGYASGPQDRGHRDGGYRDRGYERENGSYDYNRPDPRYNGYYADHYYREDSRYGERRLSNEDRVYRGQNGRYYCRRSDGSTGLIIGGLGGAAVGSMLAEGDSKPLGAILGAIGGAAVGASVDSNNVRCR